MPHKIIMQEVTRQKVKPHEIDSFSTFCYLLKVQITTRQSTFHAIIIVHITVDDVTLHFHLTDICVKYCFQNI